MTEYYVALEVVQRILSDPEWSKKAKKVSCKDEFRKLLLDFCRENGEIIRVNEKAMLLYVNKR